MPERIFIQIASYRDPELGPTIRDCLAKAAHPENLVFGIAWQHSLEEKLPDIVNGSQFRVIDIDCTKAKGVCWARNQVQRMYSGEEYTLQLDSHHRFNQSWDTTLINMLKELQVDGSPKPLITAYVPSYDPTKDPEARVTVPWQMNFDRFIPEGTIFFRPGTIPNWKNLTKPVRARYYSAHFAFTLGQFCNEVRHDPELYFHGEELNIAVRAFTWGYDLYHPHTIVAYHEYTRKGRQKHWDDHKNWHEINAVSHLRTRRFFGIDGEKHEAVQWGEYDFGTVRTVHDYEVYAGICFSKRSVQGYTHRNEYPPNPKVENWEQSFMRIFKHCIDLSSDDFKLNDYDFCVVAFEREDGFSLHRKDLDTDEFATILRKARSGNKAIQIWREFECECKPDQFVIWPHSTSKGWGEKIVRKL